MEILKLALQSGLPLIYISTEDTINVEDVLTHIAGEPVKPVALPEKITNANEIKFPSGRLFYTSSECKSLVKLYKHMVEQDKTVIFINTEKSVLQFDGGTLFPPKDLVRQFLSEVVEDEDMMAAILPTYGGLTLKDIGEVTKMTMTRDDNLTPRGINNTRRSYMGRLKGIQQVDTEDSYYIPPSYLGEWLTDNSEFYKNPVHQSLTPRGLLLDGPPGTGKTAAAKHVAKELGVPLYRLDLGAMKGKYVGESEGNLMAALTQIDQVEPCVVILDEIEKIFQTNGDSGVTSSLLSQLLWWLQEHKTQVFTIMTTNKKESIPPELYREGRIDAVMMFMGLEDFKVGYEFAKGALDTMASEVHLVLKASVYTQLSKKLKTMFSDGGAVAQVKVIGVTHDLIKQELALKQKGESNVV